MDKFKKSLLYSISGSLFLLMIFAFSHIISGLTIFSLASSVFIVFAFPTTDSSRPRFLVGGYVVASVWGLVFSFVATNISLGEMAGFDINLIWYVLTFAFTMFTMVYKNFEHPPATAYAISVAASAKPMATVALALVSILLLSFIRQISERYARSKSSGDSKAI